MKDILNGFKAFILRGNLIDLAVAIVIGLAFVAVVNSLVTNLLTPIISIFLGESSLRTQTFEINGSIFAWGAFVNDVIQFVAVAAAVYFFVVVPYNKLTERMKHGQPEPDATTKVCPECISTIPIEAKRCAFCAQPV